MAYMCLILLPVVGLVSLLDTSIVSNVLALCVDPVEGLVDRLGGVVAVLPDDAVGLLEELVLGGVVPPVGQVACVVVLPALVVEPVGDLVTNHLINNVTSVLTCNDVLILTHPMPP